MGAAVSARAPFVLRQFRCISKRLRNFEANRVSPRGRCGSYKVNANMINVTQILSKVESGDSRAASDLLPLIYDELRQLAAARMAGERPDHTLQATALVHEAYVRLVDTDRSQHWDSRGHFFSAAAEAMRRILVDSAKRRRSLRRGGGQQRIELDQDFAETVGHEPDELLDFDEALQQLALEDPRTAELVKLRVFGGLAIREAAQSLGLPKST